MLMSQDDKIEVTLNLTQTLKKWNLSYRFKC